ncbi:hypothetical protein E2562_038779 [Oryza meyeriana var. granulata]|uniref:Uncharacterized protein n=1 Tax=Oryza meyeriana var. granulata TaxID=110450 RepID=A0A6G1FH11_9ORYZ|nr:hypothetical protein E2562_038779 [Oryza meyeriana var. granulata]
MEDALALCGGLLLHGHCCLVALSPCLDDGEGLPLAFECPQGFRHLLPGGEDLDALHVQGGAFPLHLGHVTVVNRLGCMGKCLQLLAPFLEMGLLDG